MIAPPPSAATRTERILFWALMSLGGLLLSLPLQVHNDDGDAMLYQVVIRHMVEDRAWLDLRYLPNAYPSFREHLPFGFWPYAAVARLWGEGAIPWTALGFGLAILGLTYALALRRVGRPGALGALGVLALTESAFAVFGRGRLDGPLVFFANLAILPLWLGWRTLPGYALATCAAAIAALIKGPFGLVPLAASCAALALDERRVRPLWAGALACSVAALPVVLFLLGDRLWGDGSWWLGYAESQLLASAIGERQDGDVAFYIPFRTVVGRFWPGFPLLLWALAQAFGPKRLRGRLEDAPNGNRAPVLAALLMLIALCIPVRKHWFHSLVAFPMLSVVAGGALAPYLGRVLSVASERFRRWVAYGVAGAVALFGVASFAGANRYLTKRPYVFCTELRPLLGREPKGTAAVVVGSYPWVALSALAAEYQWTPYVEPTYSEEEARIRLLAPEYAQVRWALVDRKQIPSAPPGFELLASTEEWLLLLRR